MHTPDDEWLEKWSRKAADNLAKCSCYMCGNPRKMGKHKSAEELTLQERKFKAESVYSE